MPAHGDGGGGRRPRLLQRMLPQAAEKVHDAVGEKNLIRRRATAHLRGKPYAFRFAVGTAYRFLCGDPPCQAAERVCHWRV